MINNETFIPPKHINLLEKKRKNTQFSYPTSQIFAYRKEATIYFIQQQFHLKIYVYQSII